MSLAKALLEAQKAMPAIEKDSKASVPTKSGGKFEYEYVSLDHLLKVVLPVLHKNDVVLVQAPTIAGLRTTLIHAPTDERIESEMSLILPQENPQGQGSAITYARRYALTAILGISGQKDDDGALASQPKAGKTASKPVTRREKLRARINELAAAADTLREAEPDTTRAELEKVAEWRSGGLSWGKLNEVDLEWLGGELADYVAAGAKGSFYDSATLAF